MCTANFTLCSVFCCPSGLNAKQSMCAEQMEEQTYLSGKMFWQALAMFSQWSWTTIQWDSVKMLTNTEDHCLFVCFLMYGALIT